MGGQRVATERGLAGEVDLALRRPLEREGAPRRAAPFLIVSAGAFALAPVLPPDTDLGLFALAAALAVLIAGACLATPWDRLPAGAQALPPLLSFAAIALLREAEGGADSGYAGLVLLPVLWLTLYGSLRELCLALAAGALTLALPILLLGEPDYPAGEWERTLVWLGVAIAVAVAVRALRAEVLAQHALRASRIQGAGEPVRPEDDCQAICAAARKVTAATAVALLEPDPQGRLAVTTAAGLDPPAQPLDPDGGGSTARLAFDAGGAVHVADARGLDPPCPLVDAADAASVLYESIQLDDQALGVLVLLWRRRVPRLSNEIAVTSAALAAEAAHAIERRDLLLRLEQQSLTDPLTSLPNRRAFNAELSRAIARAGRDGTPLSVASLELDGFEEFCERHGDQAGERLLKEAAAGWYDRLREGDMLAFHGGDRFGAIFHACDARGAREAVERVRSGLPAGHTASAGSSTWNGSEPAASLVERADATLREARRSGRLPR